MSLNRNIPALKACAGLSAAPAIWILNTQLGQILPYLDCQQQARYSAIATFAGAVAAFVAGAISWRAARQPVMSEPTPVLNFIGSIGALSGLIFAFALSLQGAASLVLSGCER
jgi:hypothetical protein